MIDVRRLRTDLDGVRAALARRGIDTAELDHAAQLDERVREVGARRDDLRSRVNAMSKEVGAAFKAGDRAGGEAKQAESRSLGEEEKRLGEEVAVLESELRDVLLLIPNLPDDVVPDGASEDDNPMIRVFGFDERADADLLAAPTATVTAQRSTRYGDHQRVPHWEIGAGLGILDLERGAKMSGSMFPMFRGAGATLVRAL
ncbi:MAG TPA: serine--tRNA ligase, partial [Acidimicrobiales bacterium]|nr:serine--tRNA ligase [Acidimicrobiales bacterium]